MKSLETVLRREAMRLKEMAGRAEKRLEKSPQGCLKVVDKGRKLDCYFRREKKEEWKYLKKAERGMVCALAQRDYDLEFVRLARERIRAIESFLKKYEKTDLRKLDRKTGRGRRKLLGERFFCDEEYVRLWQEYKYEGLPFGEETSEIITEKGERVRSKSEKIIADKLYALGIPYRYECPLVLQNNIVMHPDFTILRVSTREEVYLEHFGMMSDDAYVERTMNKLATYERSGIYPGVNLFMTFETGKRVLNVRALDDMLRRLFCEE